ncbi:RimK family alpha-L-glutamate ligase [Sphingorhabdus sp.]|uniref:ATP-grasp domain-containing protein n=1 Tax=Sphingorhabdus sp. TaxID=1902408 RepID=UPI00391AFF15
MNGQRIAILSPTPDYEENWSHIKADYAQLLGNRATFIDWTKAEDFSAFDLVTPLLAWGYPRNCPRWFGLLDQLENEGVTVSNPVRILRWNSDKAYLAELDAAGIPSVPTLLSDALDEAALDDARNSFKTDILVIKPPISGGADGTFRLGRGDAFPASVAGHRMMIQPYLPTIAAEGEYSLFYFGGKFSHSIIKRPAKGDFRVQEQYGGTEEAVSAPEAALLLAQTAFAATAAITGIETLAYARVDLLRDGDGVFRLMELELIEPSLFLRFAPDKGTAFAEALLSAV